MPTPATHPFAKLLQNVHLHQCLLMETLLVADDLDGHKRSGLVIHATHNLTKAAFTQHINHLIPIRQMVAKHNVVVPSVVVVPVIVRGVVQNRRLLLALGTNAVHIRVVQDFFALILGQVLALRTLQDR